MYDVYNVKDGETAQDVAKMVGSSKDEIYQLNGFDADFSLKPGMLIVVPKVKKSNFWYYTVKKGDNLYQISKRYGVDYPVLLVLNGLDDGDYIYPNQTLMIPNNDIDIYLTKDNDTIGKIMERNNYNLSDFIEENENVCLREQQIIIFKNK